MSTVTGPSTPTTPAAPKPAPEPKMSRVVAVEVGEQLRALVRDPAALFFSMLMPVGFFALFVGLFGGEESGGVPVGTTMLATFGTFGVLGVALLTTGIAVAEDRERGWLRVKVVSATSLPTMLAAKVAAVLPIALGVLVLMTAVAAAFGVVDITIVTWVRLVAVLVVGAVPFALLGLAVGFLATANGATAVLNAILFPMAVASGLWMPLETLPALVQDVAPFLPAYHLAQLGLAQIHGTGGWEHLGPLALAAAVFAALATAAYRRLQP